MNNSIITKQNNRINSKPQSTNNTFSKPKPLSKNNSSSNSASSQNNTSTIKMPRKSTKIASKSPKKYASKNLANLKSRPQKKAGTTAGKKTLKLRTKKPASKNKHANNNKRARSFSLISDQSSDDIDEDDSEEDDDSLDIEIDDYESQSDDDDEDDDDSESEDDSSSSDSDVDFVKLTAQRKKNALRAAKGLKKTHSGKRTFQEPDSTVNNNNKNALNNDSALASDDDSDINFSFEFDSDKDQVEDVGEEVDPGVQERTKSKSKRRLTNLDKGSLLPVPKINDDSDLPLSEVSSSDNENAIMSDSSDDDNDDDYGEKRDDDSDGYGDDEQEIDKDKLAAAIAADENDPADAYDDVTLAQKKKEKLNSLKKFKGSFDDEDHESTVLSDDDELLDKETANLLEQMKNENDLYFMNNGFADSSDFFLGVGSEADILSNSTGTPTTINNRRSVSSQRKKSIVPRLSIVEDPKDVVLRDRLRKKNSATISNNDNDDDDDEVIEFVSDDDKNNNKNFQDDDDEDDDEDEVDDNMDLLLFDDLYYKPSMPFNLGSGLNTGNKYLDAYDQTGDDSFFWDYLLGDSKNNSNNTNGNDISSTGNSNEITQQMGGKKKRSKSKSVRSNSRKFSNQRHSLVKSELGGHRNSITSTANGNNSNKIRRNSTLPGTNFDLSLGTSESFMNYQAFFSDEDDELTDEEENLPVSSAKNIGSRSVKEVLSSAKVNGGGAPRMATWIAAKDRPFEIIDGLSTRSVLPYTLKNGANQKKTAGGAVGNIHKRNVSMGADLKFDEFFNLSELEENADDNINWSALTSGNSLNKRKVPLTAFRNRGQSHSNSNPTDFTRRYSNASKMNYSSSSSSSGPAAVETVIENILKELPSLPNRSVAENNASSTTVTAAPAIASVPIPISAKSGANKVRQSRGYSMSKSNKIRKNLKQSLLTQDAKDSKFVINNTTSTGINTGAKQHHDKARQRRKSSVMEANQEGLVFTENGLFSENVLMGVEEFLAETGEFENDELSSLLSGIQF